MKPRSSLPFLILTAVLLFLTAFWLFESSAAAQHSEHHPEQANPQTESPTGSMMSGGMMSSGMMTHGMAMWPQMMSGGMMAQHQETLMLISQLRDSFTALETETDPAVLKSKLEEHGALLQQLETKFQPHAEMMQKMMEQMSQQPQGGTAPEQK